MSKIVDISPTETQALCWEYLQDDVTDYILFGGASGGGKSTLSCQYVLVLCMTYPGVRIGVGRKELKAVRSSWLQTFFKVCRDAGLEPFDHFKLNSQDNFIQFKNGSRVDLLDLSDQPGDEFFMRYGSFELTSFICEEASEVSSACIDMFKSRVGRCRNAEYGIHPKILLTSNPSKNWLYTEYYLPYIQKTLPKNYAVVLSLPKDNPHLPGYTEQLMQITDPSQRQRMLGDWNYADHESSLIEYDAICDMWSGVVGAKVQGGKRYISADVARFGSDSTVLMLWSGLRLERIEKYQGLSNPEVVQKILNLKQAYNVPVSSIVCDSDGNASGVVDALPGCVSIINNSSPIVVDQQKHNYSNLKVQLYIMLAQKINEREIFIEVNDPKIKSDLTQELEQCKLLDRDGKLQLVGKKEIKRAINRSPDLMDSMAYAMYFQLKPPTVDPVFYVYNDYERPPERDEGKVNFNIYSKFPSSFI